MNNKKRRFYAADSSLYGLTVYDRESQTPAFAHGATTKMSLFSASSLAGKLNRLYKSGDLTSLVR